MAIQNTAILMGNGALARGLIEQGCEILTGYPGTPSSEIITQALGFKKKLGLNTHIEWSTNEKVAFEIALTAAMTGKRSAVTMKQVGLNVASDPLMSSAYTGVIGGFIVISCDDPGPHSSQTEQDSRFFALFAKVPVFDPSSPEEARNLVAPAYEISEKFEIPVILRSTTSICHGRQSMALYKPMVPSRKANFKKDPHRWAATPKFRYLLHNQLNQKLAELENQLSQSPHLNWSRVCAGQKVGVVCSGSASTIVEELLEENGLSEKVAFLKISTPFPLPQKLVADFGESLDRILVVEEPSPVIEMQIADKSKIFGRFNGAIPLAGELTPEVIYQCLENFLAPTSLSLSPAPWKEEIESALAKVETPTRKPSLCPGCPHRSSFLAIKRAFPKAIFASDIGCYTLGINLQGVDTCLDMGGSIAMADGFYKAYAQDGQSKTIVATIGDSTFFHSGTGPLLNAVYSRSRFILVILDNQVTAMTGMQPTFDSPHSLIDSPCKVALEDLVKGCGVKYLKIIDPYDFEGFRTLLKSARKYTQSEEGGPAVIIARAPCILHDKPALEKLQTSKIEVTDKCNGCMYCIDHFECRALQVGQDCKVIMDYEICVHCGSCITSCPTHCFIRVPEGAYTKEES